MNLTFAKTVDALTPVVNTLILNRMQRPAQYVAGNVEGRIEYEVRRAVAGVLGMDVTDLGLGIDDMIAELAARTGTREAHMTDVEKAHFVVRAYRRWNTN